MTVNKINCEYCDIKISRTNISRHYRIACKNIPDEHKEYYKKKRTKDKRTITHMGTYDTNVNSNNINNSHETNTNSHNNNTTNNNSHNNTTTNNNITNNNVTKNKNIIIIQVNPFGTLDYNVLTEEDRIEILNAGQNAIRLTMEKIMKHPSNMNAYISNIREKIVKCIGNDGEIKNKSLNDAMETIIGYCSKTYEDIVEKGKDLVDKRTYLSNKDRKTSIIKNEYSDKLEDEARIALISNKESSKGMIDRYIECKEDKELYKFITKTFDEQLDLILETIKVDHQMFKVLNKHLIDKALKGRKEEDKYNIIKINNNLVGELIDKFQIRLNEIFKNRYFEKETDNLSNIHVLCKKTK